MILDTSRGTRAKIRFGLGAIKGVGDGAAQKIIEERRANGPYVDFRDFVRRVDSKAVNRRVLEALVKTGAFDFTGESRGSIFYRLDALISEAAQHQRDLSARQDSFLDLLHADVQAQPAVESHADPSKAFSQGEMLQYEKELVGFYISGHPLDAFSGLAEAVNSHREEALPELPDRSDFRLCGVASGITKRLSKRDNQPWAFFNLATRSGTIQVNCYSDAFAEYGSFLENEKAIVVTGSVLNRDGDIRYAAREIQPLARALPELVKKITWVLRPEAPAEPFLRELRAVLDRQSGPTHMAIGFVDENDHVATAEVSQFLRWRVDPVEFKRLRHDPVIVGCLVEAKGIPPAAPRRWSKRNGNGGNGGE